MCTTKENDHNRYNVHIHFQHWNTCYHWNVCASSWMDRKVVTVMSNTSQPESSTVLRCQKNGLRIPVPCPTSIMDYNNFMGGVDRGDQLRGYYSCRTKCRKFYRYIFYLLLDVAITNATKRLLCERTFQQYQGVSTQAGKQVGRGLLQQETCWSQWRSCAFSSSPTFPHNHPRSCSNKKGETQAVPMHQVLRQEQEECFHLVVLCQVWLCHTGQRSTDCFLSWHAQLGPEQS